MSEVSHSVQASVFEVKLVHMVGIILLRLIDMTIKCLRRLHWVSVAVMRATYHRIAECIRLAIVCRWKGGLDNVPVAYTTVQYSTILP